MPAHAPSALTTLSVALLFAAIFLFGGRAAYHPGQRGRRRFLSFAAGILRIFFSDFGNIPSPRGRG